MGDSEKNEEVGACLITDPITGDQICRVMTPSACQSVGGVFRGGPCAPTLEREMISLDKANNVPPEMVERVRKSAVFSVWLSNLGSNVEAHMPSLDPALFDILSEADNLKEALYEINLDDDPFGDESLDIAKQVSESLARIAEMVPQVKDVWDSTVLKKLKDIKKAKGTS